MRAVHRALILRDEEVDEGISVDENLIKFSPRWGGQDAHSALATSSMHSGTLYNVTIARAQGGTYLEEAEAEPDWELVQVQQYSPGCGAKRWPSFHIKEYGKEVTILSTCETRGGSGGETWKLVSAPLGWARNIAQQVVNVRDGEDQEISYLPPIPPMTVGDFGNAQI